MADTFQGQGTGLTSPAVNAVAVTPNDSTDLAQVSRALWVGTAGDLRVIMAGGQTVTFPDMAVGWHPLRVSRVLSTSTTASGIVSVW